MEINGLENKKNILLIFIIILILSLSCSLLLDWSNDGLRAGEDLYYGTDPLQSDTNSDGLTDYKEIKVYKTDPLKEDTDSDGLTDYEEIKEYNTNPLQSDTNSDGLTDYEEIKIYETNPLKKDTNGDGLTDYKEIKVYKTDPLKNDTNGDGLSDYREVKVYETNPLENNTDSDGLTDYEEVEVHNTNPLQTDTDSDGLTDYKEIKVHETDPNKIDTNNDGLTDYKEIKVYETDPLKKDTDSDKLSDYEEVTLHNTDPNKKDTNGDGLTDYEEIKVYETDPLKNDTDNDSLDDVKEVNIGTDPTELDTSGNGLPDGYKYRDSSLDVERLNIIVEIAYTKKAGYPDGILNVVDKFDKAPVTSNMGKEGINLVLVGQNNSVSGIDTVSLDHYINNHYKNRLFNGYGAYHALFVHQIPSLENKNTVGITRESIDGMLVQYDRDTDRKVSSTFMHELGHQLGLLPSVFDGIDSTKYTWEEYPSVMNYNGPSCSLVQTMLYNCESKAPLKLTDSEWRIIEDNIDTNTPDISKVK